MIHHALSLWIVCVAAVDAWFCLHDGPSMRAFELNPLARGLIDAGGVHLLVASKVFGTAVCVYVASQLRTCWRPAVLYSLSAVQMIVVVSYLPRAF